MCFEAPISASVLRMAVSMPRPSTSTFRSSKSFEIVLVPLDDGALRHGGILYRHQLRQRPGGDHEAADVLGEMARKAEDFLHQRGELRGDAAVAGNAGFLEAIHHLLAVVPPGHVLGQQVHEVVADAQRLADIADGAARAIGDERGGERGAVAAVALVDVLDHFLAPLVLEVHVDVRRLVALLGHEALEQQMHLGGVQFGDAEAEAHCRVGGGAAPLAEDVAALGEAHDVLHGEEEVFVAELGDELELLVEGLGRRRGNARWPASPGAGQGELAQMFGWRQAGGHQFAGVVVAQFVHLESAAVGEIHGLGEHLPRVDRGELVERP